MLVLQGMSKPENDRMFDSISAFLRNQRENPPGADSSPVKIVPETPLEKWRMISRDDKIRAAAIFSIVATMAIVGLDFVKVEPPVLLFNRLVLFRPVSSFLSLASLASIVYTIAQVAPLEALRYKFACDDFNRQQKEALLKEHPDVYFFWSGKTPTFDKPPTLVERFLRRILYHPRPPKGDLSYFYPHQ